MQNHLFGQVDPAMTAIHFLLATIAGRYFHCLKDPQAFVASGPDDWALS
jgi:hypothetical protein